jgi:hypothetical protein
VTSPRPLDLPLHSASRAYRNAHAVYARAFVRGDVGAIEDAFSRMQEIGRAFEEGAKWARTQPGVRAEKQR